MAKTVGKSAVRKVEAVGDGVKTFGKGTVKGYF